MKHFILACSKDFFYTAVKVKTQSWWEQHSYLHKPLSWIKSSAAALAPLWHHTSTVIFPTNWVWSTLRVPANHHLLPAPFPLLNCCSLPDIWKQNRQEHPDWLCSIPLAPDIFSLGKQRDTDCGWGKWDLLGELHSNYIYFRIIQVHLITPGVSLILLQLNPGGFRLGWNVKYQLKQKKKTLRYSQNGCFPKMLSHFSALPCFLITSSNQHQTEICLS